MRILLRFSLGFVAAAILTVTLLPAPLALLLAALLLLPGVVLSHRRRGPGPALLGLAVGLLWTLGYQCILLRPLEPLDGRQTEITGTALEYSRETAYGQRLTASITADGTTARALVWLYTDRPLAPGDTFSVTARLELPAGTYESLNRAGGVRLLAYGKGAPEITPAAAVPLRFWPKSFARRMEQTLSACVPADALSCAVALATGNRDGLTAAQRQAFQTSGVYHAMALSGMHLSVLVGALSLLVRNRRRRAVLGIPLCAVFALITGLSPSIVRAAVMQILLLLASLLRREEDAPTSLGTAALLMTAQNPYCVFGWGLQLSFASMAGILLFSERFYAGLDRRLPGKGKIRGGVLSSLSSTAAASLCAAPFLMLHFGCLSLIAPVTNLFVTWAIAWCFRGSLLTALCGMLCMPLGKGLGWLLAWPIRYVQAVTAFFAGVPYAVLDTSSVYVVGWVLLVYAVALIYWRTPKDRRRPAVPACAVLAGLIACLFFGSLGDPGVGMTVLGDEQAVCVLFSARNQQILLTDGPPEAAAGLALQAMELQGADRLDAWIFTTPQESFPAAIPAAVCLAPSGDGMQSVQSGDRIAFSGGQITLFQEDGALSASLETPALTASVFRTGPAAIRVTLRPMAVWLGDTSYPLPDCGAVQLWGN